MLRLIGRRSCNVLWACRWCGCSRAGSALVQHVRSALFSPTPAQKEIYDLDAQGRKYKCSFGCCVGAVKCELPSRICFIALLLQWSLSSWVLAWQGRMWAQKHCAQHGLTHGSQQYVLLQNAGHTSHGKFVAQDARHTSFQRSALRCACCHV